MELQDTVVPSTTKAEYMAAVVASKEALGGEDWSGNSTSGRIQFGFMEMIR